MIYGKFLWSEGACACRDAATTKALEMELS